MRWLWTQSPLSTQLKRTPSYSDRANQYSPHHPLSPGKTARPHSPNSSPPASMTSANRSKPSARTSHCRILWAHTRSKGEVRMSQYFVWRQSTSFQKEISSNRYLQPRMNQQTRHGMHSLADWSLQTMGLSRYRSCSRPHWTAVVKKPSMILISNYETCHQIIGSGNSSSRIWSDIMETWRLLLSTYIDKNCSERASTACIAIEIRARGNKDGPTVRSREEMWARRRSGRSKTKSICSWF